MSRRLHSSLIALLVALQVLLPSTAFAASGGRLSDAGGPCCCGVAASEVTEGCCDEGVTQSTHGLERCPCSATPVPSVPAPHAPTCKIEFVETIGESACVPETGTVVAPRAVVAFATWTARAEVPTRPHRLLHQAFLL